MTAMKRVRALGVLPLLLLAVQACSDGRTAAPLALALAPASGLEPSAVVGTSVSPSVLLVDERGRSQSGARITFEVTAGGGHMADAVVITDAGGRATGAWTLGTTTGSNTVVARSAAGLNVTFKVTAIPDAPVLMQAVAAVPEVSPATGRVSVEPAVRVTDRHGNGVSGIQVAFAASAGGSVTAAQRQTGADGVASAGVWTTGPQEGDNVLTAQASGLPSVTFVTRAVLASASGVLIARLGGDQTTCPVNTNGCSFSVRVTNLNGAPMPGEAILWRGPGGATTTTVTNAQGLSTTVNQGTLSAAGTFTQTARLVGSGDEVAFTYRLVQPDGFNIDLRFLTPVSPSVRTAFEQARLRWQQAITGNLSEFPLTGTNQVAANACGITHPAVNEVVDDLLILIEIDSIDGPGKILGSAGPCMLRASSGLPILGVMKLDRDDLAAMSTNGSLRDVILHEIGHVLGLGTLWSRAGLLQGAGSEDPYFSGSRAQPGFLLGGGTILNGIPVENTGGAGTRDSHWRETTLRNELMTGWLNSGTNPLSAITVGSLMDLGYEVNFGAADTYSLPFGSLSGQSFGLGTIELIELPLPEPRRVW